MNKLFDNLVLISYYEIIRTNNSILIKAVYADEDTNENGIIDFNDEKAIGLYDLDSESFSTLSLKNKYISISSIYDKRLNALVILGKNDLPDQKPTYEYFRYAFDSQTVTALKNPI